jgi:indole-3-acetate monooxygenase
VTSPEPVSAARELAATAAELAAEGEKERRLMPRLVEGLVDAGLFRLCVPASLGGLESPAATLVEAVEELARGDGAAGWCVAVNATSGLLGGYLEEEPARTIFGDPRSVAGGVFAPRGRATATQDGFRVTGRWPFASGCRHCDWLMGGCVVEDGDDVRRLPNGQPDVRLMLAPAAEVIVHDTWRVAGLRATGSHDIEFAALRIPEGHGTSVFTDRPTAGGPLYAFPLFGLLAIAIAGVNLGIGRGALDDVIELAAARTPSGSSRTLAQRTTAQAEVARAEASLRAARALLHETIGEAWEEAVATKAVSVERRGALRLAATHATVTGAAVAETAFRLGGASAIYDESPLQRRFRDAQVATQHMLVGASTWELAGRLLLGQPTDATQL